MSLHIVLGIADKKPTTEPVVVYAGRNGAAARKAMDESTSEHFMILSNPLCIPKHNKHAAANRAKQRAGAAPAQTPPNSPEQGEPSQAPSTSAAEPAEASKPGGRRR